MIRFQLRVALMLDSEGILISRTSFHFYYEDKTQMFFKQNEFVMFTWNFFKCNIFVLNFDPEKHIRSPTLIFCHGKCALFIHIC